FVPPGLAVADAHVSAQAPGSSLSPSERSGFLNIRNDDPAAVEPNAQTMAQGTFLRGLESERPAAPQTANVWSATIERLAAEISTHIRQNRHEVTMHLEPPELGNLRIELSLDGDRLQARVTADVADAGNLIQTHLPELRQALQAHKLDLVNVQVDLSGWAGLGAGLAQDSRQQSRESADPATLAAISHAGDGEAKEPSRPTSVAGGSVSVWA
ncbi:MAG: flagellar hook-length control protein FliK, partial [Candidatus Binatia bacterium]